MMFPFIHVLLAGLTPLMAIALLGLAFRLYWPSIAGWVGETRIRFIISRLPKPAYASFHNVILPLDANETTQVDHIVFGPTVCFVIETKAHAGWIYGKASDRKWTQVFNRYAKFIFQNPIMQNVRHVNAVRRFTGDMPVHNLVVFIRAHFPEGKPAGVFSPEKLIAFIRSFEKDVAHVDVNKEMNSLVSAILTSPQAKKAHKRKLQKCFGGRWRVPAGHICTVFSLILFSATLSLLPWRTPMAPMPYFQKIMAHPFATMRIQPAIPRQKSATSRSTPVQVIGLSKGHASILEDGKIITLHIGQRSPGGWMLAVASSHEADFTDPKGVRFHFTYDKPFKRR